MIYLVAVAIGLPLGLLLVMATLLLVTSLDFQPWALCLTALIWLGPFLLGGAWFVRTVRRRAAALDALFVPLGLEGKAYMSYFRQYHGTLYGRQVDVYLWRGPYLAVEVSTPLATRFGITQWQSDTSLLAGMAGKQPIALADPQLAALQVFPADEAWTRSLLADPTATDALRRLTALGSTIFTRQQVLLRPGTLQLLLSGNRRMFGLDITAEQARLWLDDLMRILQVAEALPAPAITDELSSSELLMMRLRARNPYMELWVMLGTFGFFVVMAVIIFAGVFLFTSLDGF